MKKYSVLYNPKSGNGRSATEVYNLEKLLPDATFTYTDITQISDVPGFLSEIPSDEGVILAGGDGTINHFINDIGGKDPGREILYFATGTGNDFLNDIGVTHGDPPFRLNEYIINLPVVYVNGLEKYFLNGIGYGIDGYCCEVGDRIRATSNKKVDYTAIAIKGLIYDYHRTSAEITIDGISKSYKKVWLSPTMKGRYIGGGMKIAPQQDRNAKDGSVSLMVMRCRSKLKTLMVFPSIFKGEHVKHTKIVDIFQGHDVHVKFDRPTALQIDGETVLNVLEYTVKAPRLAEKKEIEKETAGIV
ncbi:MAG: diacylglycerol kinase family protein [Ruminococcaceae bacterium]|nr:diacylglycerol kinase family protein [Oscillospiraceae bacterium]